MSGLDNHNRRLEYMGGKDPIDRLNEMKRRSLRGALKDAYQSVKITRLVDGKDYQCLINPDKLHPNYDNKVISIPFSTGLKAGEVFQWVSTDTYWLVYLQELTETAYLRAEIRRCSYQIKIAENDYYIYVRGPEETASRWSQKSDLTWNQLNYSLSIMIEKNEETLEYLKRFSKLRIDGRPWKVEAVDSLSMVGIIEVVVIEDFENTLEDASIVPVAEPINYNDPHIEGPAFVKPFDIVSYSAALVPLGAWSIEDESKAKILSFTGQSVEVEIVAGRKGNFELKYTYTEAGSPTEISLNIYIESF